MERAVREIEAWIMSLGNGQLQELLAQMKSAIDKCVRSRIDEFGLLAREAGYALSLTRIGIKEILILLSLTGVIGCPKTTNAYIDETPEANARMLSEPPPVLSPNDAIAEEKLNKAYPSGTTFTSKNFNLEINRAWPSLLFEIEIKNRNFNKGKKQAVEWLRNQGLSKNALCKMHIEFYPSRESASDSAHKYEKISSLMDGCSK